MSNISAKYATFYVYLRGEEVLGFLGLLPYIAEGEVLMKEHFSAKNVNINKMCTM